MRSHLLSLWGKKQKQKNYGRATRVAQSVKHLTLDFSSGRDLVVHEILYFLMFPYSMPRVRLCTHSTDPAWDSLSLPLPPLKINKH